MLVTPSGWNCERNWPRGRRLQQLLAAEAGHRLLELRGDLGEGEALPEQDLGVGLLGRRLQDVQDVAHGVLGLQLVVARREHDLALALGVPREHRGAGDEALALEPGREGVERLAGVHGEVDRPAGVARRVELAHQPEAHRPGDEDGGHGDGQQPEADELRPAAALADRLALEGVQLARGVPGIVEPVVDGAAAPLVHDRDPSVDDAVTGAGMTGARRTGARRTGARAAARGATGCRATTGASPRRRPCRRPGGAPRPACAAP